MDTHSDLNGVGRDTRVSSKCQHTMWIPSRCHPNTATAVRDQACEGMTIGRHHGLVMMAASGRPSSYDSASCVLVHGWGHYHAATASIDLLSFAPFSVPVAEKLVAVLWISKSSAVMPVRQFSVTYSELLPTILRVIRDYSACCRSIDLLDLDLKWKLALN